MVIERVGVSILFLLHVLDCSTLADSQKEMDLDRTYTREGSEQHQTIGLKAESPWEKMVRVDQGLKEHMEKSVEDEMSKAGHS